MDHLFLREREVDLESGETTTSEDEKTKRRELWSDVMRFDRIGKNTCSVNSCSGASSISMIGCENMEFLVEKDSEGEENHEPQAIVDNNFTEEHRKKTNSRKAPKPPLPPKPPLLDAADKKLVREIAELALLKRTRMKRIKAMKKMKAAKASSSNSSVSAFVITVLFFLIILFQGICSRHGSNLMLEGSPAPAVGSNEGLISVQLYKSFPTTTGEHDNDPPSVVNQQLSSSIPARKMPKE